MATAKRNKETICATVSPYLKKQVEELVASEDFSSMSDLVSIAISEFVGAYKRQQKEKKSLAPNVGNDVIQFAENGR